MKFVLGLVLTLGGSTWLFAKEGLSTSVREGRQAPPSCISAWKDPAGISVGFICAAENGDTYERVQRDGFGIAWKDLQTGIIWSEAQIVKADLSKHAYWDDSWDHCEAMNAQLPLPEDCVEVNVHTQWFPMSWPQLFQFYTSKLDDRNGVTIPLIARTCSGFHPELSNGRNSSGSFGGVDRRRKLDVYTVCIDDSQALHPKLRPQKPEPVDRIEN